MAAPGLEVLIAGAGPAGVATAVAILARRPDLRGEVALVDRARFPRDKPCGGGLTGHAQDALAALGLALRVPVAVAEVGRLMYGGLVRDVALPRAVAVVERRAFDADLVAQAEARGVLVWQGEGVRAVSWDTARRPVVETSLGRTLRPRVLVGADGAGSVVRRALVRRQGGSAWGAAPGPQRERPLRLFRAEVPRPPGPRLPMIYDFSPMDDGLRGYLWLFPMPGDRLNVGVMHTPSRALSGAEISACLGRALRRHGVTVGDAAHGWPAWPWDASAPLAAPGVLLVGDAAGIDALTGEGIAVGLEHGILAAAQVERALAGDPHAFSSWARTLAGAPVGRELRLDAWAARLLYPARGVSLGLALAMHDGPMQRFFAERIAGGAPAPGRKRLLVRALGRHALHWPWRLAALARARDVAAFPAAVDLLTGGTRWLV